MLTCGCGARPGVAARAEGFFARSTILMSGCIEGGALHDIQTMKLGICGLKWDAIDVVC